MYAVYMYVYIDSNFCGDRTWNRMRVNVECAIATRVCCTTFHVHFSLTYLIKCLPWPGAPVDNSVCGGQLSTTCTNATEVGQLAAPSCGRPLLATDNGVKNIGSNLQLLSPFTGQYPLSATCWCKCGLKIKSLVNRMRTCNQRGFIYRGA